MRERGAHGVLDDARALRVLSTVAAWFVAATLALAVILLAVNGGEAGPRMGDAVWGGAVVAIAVLLGGRAVLPALLERLAWRLLPNEARRRGPRAPR